MGAASTFLSASCRCSSAFCCHGASFTIFLRAEGAGRPPARGQSHGQVQGAGAEALPPFASCTHLRRVRKVFLTLLRIPFAMASIYSSPQVKIHACARVRELNAYYRVCLSQNYVKIYAILSVSS